MDCKTFNRLYADAVESPSLELFIAERGWQADWMDDYGEDAAQLVADMENIYLVAKMTIRDLIDKTGMTQAAFAERFVVPLRTVQNWAIKHRECPCYVKIMMAEELGVLTVKRQ